MLAITFCDYCPSEEDPFFIQDRDNMVLRRCPSCASLFLLFLCLSSLTWRGSSAYLNDCKGPLGLQDGRISNSQLSSPNHYENFYIGSGEIADMGAGCARLNNTLAWCSPSNKYSDIPAYIEVDFNNSVEISGIATQGFRSAINDYYVMQYNVSYSNDRVSWKLYKEVLVGNTDVQTAVTNTFNPEISARYIRVYPIKYRLRVCMRLELYGLTKCPIPPSKSIPQLQEDPTQTITTSTTAEPEHQTPTSTIATLRKETTVTRETGPVDVVTPTTTKFSSNPLNVATSRDKGKNTPFSPTAGVLGSVSSSQVSAVAHQEPMNPSTHLVVALSVTAAVVIIFMVPVTIFLFFLRHRKQNSWQKFPSSTDSTIPLTTAVVDENLFPQEYQLMYGLLRGKCSVEEVKFQNKCAV